jgi:transcriptional regulator with XRE-family HTH domain
MTTGTKISELRKKRGLTQEQLAHDLGIARQSISKWEVGEALPDTPTVIRLADYFGVTVDYLLRESQESPAVDADKEERTKPTLSGKNLTLLILAIAFGFVCLLSIIVGYETPSEWNYFAFWLVYGIGAGGEMTTLVVAILLRDFNEKYRHIYIFLISFLLFSLLSPLFCQRDIDPYRHYLWPLIGGLSFSLFLAGAIAYIGERKEKDHGWLVGMANVAVISLSLFLLGQLYRQRSGLEGQNNGSYNWVAYLALALGLLLLVAFFIHQLWRKKLTLWEAIPFGLALVFFVGTFLSLFLPFNTSENADYPTKFLLFRIAAGFLFAVLLTLSIIGSCRKEKRFQFWVITFAFSLPLFFLVLAGSFYSDLPLLYFAIALPPLDFFLGYFFFANEVRRNEIRQNQPEQKL